MNPEPLLGTVRDPFFQKPVSIFDQSIDRLGHIKGRMNCNPEIRPLYPFDLHGDKRTIEFLGELDKGRRCHRGLSKELCLNALIVFLVNQYADPAVILEGAHNEAHSG